MGIEIIKSFLDFSSLTAHADIVATWLPEAEWLTLTTFDYLFITVDDIAH